MWSACGSAPSEESQQATSSSYAASNAGKSSPSTCSIDPCSYRSFHFDGNFNTHCCHWHICRASKRAGTQINVLDSFGHLFKSGPNIRDWSCCLLNPCHYVTPSCCDSCPCSNHATHLEIRTKMFLLCGGQGHWVVEIQLQSDILFISLSSKPNTQMNGCFLYLKLLRNCWKTSPLSRMVNFHFPIVEISSPNIPSPETQSIDFFCFSMLIFLCATWNFRDLKLRMAKRDALGLWAARLINNVLEIHDFLPLKGLIKNHQSSRAVNSADENIWSE